MSYIQSEGTLLGANLKKGGKMIIQIEVTQDLDSREDYYHLRKMIEKSIKFSLSSQVVNYNVEINTRTDKPIRNYKVDERGVVSEVKPEGEQVSMDKELGLPPEKVEIKNEAAVIDLAVIEDFILSGLAPSYDDLPYDFLDFSLRLSEGDTYMKIALDEGLSSGRLVEVVDEYRRRVAPLAAKWDEWRQGKVKPTQEDKVETDEQPEQKTEEQQTEGQAGQQDQQEGTDTSSETDEGSGDQAPEIDKEELEKFILEKRPIFDDIKLADQPVDFPALLQKRHEGKTWMDISKELNIPSSQISSKYGVYKKRVAKMMKDNGAA